MIKSSQNPKKESLTVIGLLTLLGPVITSILRNNGVEIADEEFMHVVDAISIAAGSIAFVFGFLRKIYNNLFKK